MSETSYTPRAAAGLLLFLTFLNVLNFVDRQLIPSLAPKLIEDLGLSYAEIGLLYGFVFIVFYTVMGLALGTAADRFHRPRLIAAGLFVWSLLTAFSGAARSFAHLAFARVFVGIGEATLTPAALSMLSDVFAPRRRGLASGFYYAGVPIGAGMSLIISGLIAPDYGWRACFYALGLVGLLVAPVLLLVRNPPRGAAEQRTPGPRSDQEKTRLSLREIGQTLLGTLRKSPALTLTIVGATMLNFAAASTIHVITWLTTERGFEYRTAAYLSGGIYTAAGMVGVVWGGWLADWFHRRWEGGRVWFLVFKGLFFVPFWLGFYLLPVESKWLYPCWFLSSLGSTSWYGPVFATVQDLAPARIRSTIVAFLLFVINLLGTGPGPWITGMIGDAHSLLLGLLLAAFVGMGSVAPLWLAARRYPIDRARIVADGG